MLPTAAVAARWTAQVGATCSQLAVTNRWTRSDPAAQVKRLIGLNSSSSGSDAKPETAASNESAVLSHHMIFVHHPCLRFAHSSELQSVRRSCTHTFMPASSLSRRAD